MCIYRAEIDHAENRIAPQPALNDSPTGEVRTNLPSPTNSLLSVWEPDCSTAGDFEAAIRGAGDGLSAPKWYPAPTSFIGAGDSGARGRLLIKIQAGIYPCVRLVFDLQRRSALEKTYPAV